MIFIGGYGQTFSVISSWIIVLTRRFDKPQNSKFRMQGSIAKKSLVAKSSIGGASLLPEIS
jgi:hypothetical protein